MFYQILHKVKKPINSTLKSIGIYDTVHNSINSLFSKRIKLAKKYLHGNGIEVGALHSPLFVPKGVKVLYVDRMDTKGLRKHYPELKNYKFMPVSIVDNGELLKTIKPNSKDFIIANHFIEHCEDPILALKNHLRILRKGGIIYWAVPNKKFTPDRTRSLTSIQHLINDHEKGTKFSRAVHYFEWAYHFRGLDRKSAEKEAKKLEKEDYSIHFHCWDENTFLKFLTSTQKKYKLPFKVSEMVPNLNEMIVVLTKNG